MEITICTGAWGRHKLLDIFCEYYAELKKVIPFKLIVACSEVDASIIVAKHGHTQVFVPNTPLYAKMNHPVNVAAGSDYVLLIGSDDFIPENTLRYYIELFKKGYDYIYTYDWHFYDTRSRHGLYWGGYNKKFNRGLPCGAGRALSKRLLKKINYTPWIKGYDRILDTGMEINLKKHTFTQHGFRLGHLGLCCIDVKTSTNMTPFEKWDNSEYIDGKKLIEENLKPVANKILSY